MEDPVQRIATIKTFIFMLFQGAKIPLRGHLHAWGGGGGIVIGGNSSGEKLS